MEAPPLIAITMGDPAGVGPEVIVKALATGRWLARARLIVVGDSRVIAGAARQAGLDLVIRPCTAPPDAGSPEPGIDVLELANAAPETIVPGQVSAATGRAAMEAIERTVELALLNRVAAVVTAPINKEATHRAGYGDIGHLEYFARVTRSQEYATMLVSGRLRVVHLTTHHSLRQACELVTTDRILQRLRLTHRSFERWGLERPRIAVAALNPHGGDGGLFGDEEATRIAPAIRAAQSEGIDAHGPHPADSVFNRAIAAEFDVVLAMYHDQGHIPVKVHGFAESVSVALGLPFVRTSVDHGTALDIAGKNVADCRSLVAAIETALLIVEGRWLT
ncbi:MAG: 4-hydroxythreonine-4-phosphate dehydrogenase PdxA [Candidatus Riflebacteria bacterium]|nr:4-hydroxythreonine-4-phosphate dehydrogenase PdxA [Candidatus Riflebacteria bacterium]